MCSAIMFVNLCPMQYLRKLLNILQVFLLNMFNTIITHFHEYWPVYSDKPNYWQVQIVLCNWPGGCRSSPCPSAGQSPRRSAWSSSESYQPSNEHLISYVIKLIIISPDIASSIMENYCNLRKRIVNISFLLMYVINFNK